MGSIAMMVITVVRYVSMIIQLLIIGSVVANLLGADPSNQIVRMLNQTTEPLFKPIRRFTSRIPGPLDWAPLVVILIVITLESGIVHFMQGLMR